MSMAYRSIKAYFFPLSLITSIVLGGLLGYLNGSLALHLKPLGDIFLNLLFTAIVPLIFFTTSSAIAKMGSTKKLEKIFCYMFIIFVVTSSIAAMSALILVSIFPWMHASSLPVTLTGHIAPITVSQQLVGIFTVPEFSQLLSHQHMLALIVFSILVGLATCSVTEKKQSFVVFLQAGENIFMRVFSIIMYCAPIGFFSYFAVLVQQLGPKLIDNYLHIALGYYAFAIGYFIIVYTLYAYAAQKKQGMSLFWKHIWLPMLTAIATCSSAASIPANLVATKKMRVPSEISEMVVPLGAMVHKEGSVIGGMVKIAFLFSLFHLDFSGIGVLCTAVGVAVLVGTVMGAIPSGGMLGELLILSIYGFPASALLMIAAISIIIDPIATLLNVTGNTVSSMLIARYVEGKLEKARVRYD